MVREKIFFEQLEKELSDLFILDVTLPDVNGPEISEKWLAGKDTLHIPVLIMFANFYNRQKAMESGIREFISKPFDIDDLLSKVKALINN